MTNLRETELHSQLADALQVPMQLEPESKATKVNSLKPEHAVRKTTLSISMMTPRRQFHSEIPC